MKIDDRQVNQQLMADKSIPLKMIPCQHIAMMFAQEWANFGKMPAQLIATPLAKMVHKSAVLWHDEDCRNASIASILKYLATDCIVYWNEHEEQLYKKQQLK